MHGTSSALWGAIAAATLVATAGVETRTAAPAPHTVATAAPKTVDVQMIGDGTGYRFAPARVTIKRGDKVRFRLVSGPPHNVVFWSDSVPKGAAAALTKGMPQTMDQLTGPFFMKPGDTYVVSFAGVPAGVYNYYCAPHLALGMKATIEVK
jgi:plastocyanin